MTKMLLVGEQAFKFNIWDTAGQERVGEKNHIVLFAYLVIKCILDCVTVWFYPCCKLDFPSVETHFFHSVIGVISPLKCDKIVMKMVKFVSRVIEPWPWHSLPRHVCKQMCFTVNLGISCDYIRRLSHTESLLVIFSVSKLRDVKPFRGHSSATITNLLTSNHNFNSQNL